MGCLDEALASIGMTRDACRRLPAAASQAQRSRWVGDRWPNADRAKMREIIEPIPTVPLPKSLELQESLNAIEDIDPGEAYLLASMYENPESFLLSGDVRMLRALHSATPYAARKVRDSITGRVIIFPQIVGMLVRDSSLALVEQRWRSASRGQLRHQKSLLVMFGSTPPTREDDFWRGCDLEVSNTTTVCGGDLLRYSFP